MCGIVESKAKGKKGAVTKRKSQRMESKILEQICSKSCHELTPYQLR